MTLKQRIVLIVVVLAAGYGMAETDTILILHTNDFHDHLRPDYTGIGGLPYISGYMQSVMASRPDVLLLDAGDVMEKGDYATFLSKSTLMYKAMGRIGFHATVPGNHDCAYGLDHLRRCGDMAGAMKILCVNWVDKSAQPVFSPSAIFDIDGIRAGVLGLARPKVAGILSLTESLPLAARESEKLDQEADLVIMICHYSSADCRKIAAAAPAIDIFISGHSHEILKEPVRTENGAYIVQAGQYARFTGRLEVTLDMETEEILAVTGGLVEMDHEAVPVDSDMLSWIREEEEKLCPEADDIVAHAGERLNNTDIGRIAAASLRWRGNGDIGFCHPSKILRGTLHPGDIDVNALFRTGGQRGHTIVALDLPGRAITAYLTGLLQSNNGMTVWDGFEGDIHFAVDRKDRYCTTALEADRVYRVILPELEWTDRMRRELAGFCKDAEIPLPEPEKCGFSFIEAIAEWVRKSENRGVPLEKIAASLKTP
jgi:2',3'-cyclic-nucleotide 2'-phosphodiesterase (5'-nucleotidase family)